MEVSRYSQKSTAALLQFARTRQPLYRNAYALMLSTGASSALGMIYWIVAARFYSPEALGLNAAAISLMILLSGAAQLNLMSAMTRYIPQAGPATGRLVGTAYVLNLIMAGATAPLVLWAMGAWGGELAADNPLFLGAFVIGTMAWGIFNLQDNVLAGLRETLWVPVENIVYAIAKIVLLVALAVALPAYGIFASWIVPMVILLLPMNYLIFRRLIPRHTERAAEQAAPLVPRDIAGFVAGNYVGSLFLLASARLLPVLVAHIAGATANAYFYMAWTIANSIHLMVTNMAVSLTVEGAADPHLLKRQTARFLTHVMRLFLPLVIVLVVAAPWILRLSGGDYEQEGTTLFRLLLLATLPHIVNALYLSIARVRKQVREIILVQALFCLFTVGLSYILLPQYGITGVGVALLTGESVLALVLLLTALRPLLTAARWSEPRAVENGPVPDDSGL